MDLLELLYIFAPALFGWFVFKAGFIMGHDSTDGVIKKAEQMILIRWGFYWICFSVITLIVLLNLTTD